MTYYADGNGNVSFSADGVSRSDSVTSIPEPPADSILRGGSKRYEWDSGSSSYVRIFPPLDKQSLFEKMKNQFESWEGSLSAGLNALDTLLSNYPILNQALSNGDTQAIKDRLDQADTDGILTTARANTLKNFVDGNWYRVKADNNVDLTSTVDPNPVGGVTLNDGDWVWLASQDATSDNGIYEADVATDPSSWNFLE